MEVDGPADADNQLAAATAAATVAGPHSFTSSSNGPGTCSWGVPSTHGPYSVVTGEADDTLFDLSLPGQQLRGHIGPVTSLCLTESCLYSGSWDYTVRCYRRGSWDCIRWATDAGATWRDCASLALCCLHFITCTAADVFLCLSFRRQRCASQHV
jgi:hypothetical protein